MTEQPGRPAIRLPPQFAERAREVLDGTVPAVTPRDAATVMLLRQGVGGQRESAGEPGLQVYMLRRRSSMAFAAGAYVFPGGSVDPADADEGIPWAGPDAEAWGRRLDTPAKLARTAALNALAAVASVAGGLSAVTQVVKMTGFVASTPDFTGQPQVVNGASELLLEVFGDAGRHARSAVAAPVLPFDSPVEIELIVEVSAGLDPAAQ